MTPHDLLANFEALAEALNGIQRLRELVLELAVRGKLVEQDPADEPAREMAKRIQQRLPIMRKRRSGTLGHSESELASIQAEVIPEGWYACNLGSVIRLINGRAYSRPELLNSGTPIIRIQNLNGGHSWFYSNLELEDDKYCVDGDLLFAWSATFGPYIWRGPRAIFHYHIWKIDLLNGCDIQFMYYLLQAISERVRSKAHGVAMLHMTKEGMEAWPVTIPPLPEQRRIVARVDELMALLDRLEAKRQEREAARTAARDSALAALCEAPTPNDVETAWLRIQERFHELFSSPEDLQPLRDIVLDLAIRGLLVSQDLTDESGHDLIKRVNSNTNKPNTCDNMSKLPFKKPNGWSFIKLESILQHGRGITYGVIKLGEEPKSGGVFILRCSNVRFRKLDTTGIRRISEKLSDEYTRTVLHGGEVLINVRGTLGGCAVVPEEMMGFNIAREVAVIPVHKQINPHFIMNVIASPYFQNRIKESLRGTAYEGLNLGLLRDFVVPIPPILEQLRIVQRIEDILGSIDVLENAIQRSIDCSVAFATAAVHHLDA